MPPVSAAAISLPSRYRLEGFIAAGGMAGVWGAQDTTLDRPVAIKVLAEHLSADEDAKRRFQREARLGASVSDHPHVVTIYDVGEHAGRAFIVMEWLRGGTIADHLHEHGRPDRATALAWLREAAGALDYAHQRGIIHRDIKPGNFLLDERRRLAVADFGIARLADATEGITQPGMVLGTAAYLSPEQALGEPATAASDRYSFAVLAYELLTGQKPFQAEHFAAQARQQVEAEPPPPSHFDPELPAAVDGVLLRGLAKDPGARWGSCAAFVDALEPALHDRAAATAATVKVATGHRAAVAAAPAEPLAPRRARRSPAGSAKLLIPFLVVLALLIGGIALLGSSGGADDDPRAGGGATSSPERRRTTEERTRSTGQQEEPQAQQATPPATAEQESAQPEATSPATPAAGQTESTGRDDGDPSALNAQGFQRMQQGDYTGAIPLLQRAVEKCGESDALDPCGYAYFNLGQSLNRAGRPDEAIPYLQTRLDRWGYDQAKTVEKELKAARKAAGKQD